MEARTESAHTPALMETEQLVKRYGATLALDGVSLSVHSGESLALVGRNGAGKSTLVRLMTGLDRPDSGQIRFAGVPAPDPSAREAWRPLVACVYQHSTVIPQLSVGENLFLNDYPHHRGGAVDWGRVRRDSVELLENWGLDLDPRVLAADLTVGQRQQLEIARALRRGSQLIILDEPTAQLESREIDHLFSQMRRLQGDGVTFVFISHHLDEIYEICSRVAVMRDGRLVATEGVHDMPKKSLVSAMVGSEYAETSTAATVTRSDAPVVLEVRDVVIPGAVNGVSLTVRAGEKVGLAGLTGSGRRELAQAVVGEAKQESGDILLGGTELRPGRVRATRDRGVGYVPEDRHQSGFSANLSVQENISLTVLERIGTAGLVPPKRQRALAQRMIDALQMKVSSPRQLVGELSGGNQQKTVMARALAVDPRLLVLLSPTAGVDVASKAALFETIRSSDAAVLLVSDEIDELSVCDRVVVMFNGYVHAEFDAGWDDKAMVAAIEGVNL